MSQNSIAYAVARVHVRQRDALDAGRLDRLLAASTYDEALRTLTEIGFMAAEKETDIEEIATEHVQRACALVKRISPCPDATDCFLLRYDALNLKTLLKARCLGLKAKNLSKCGVYPVEILEHAVADHQYKKLPDILLSALNELEKVLSIREDALFIDAQIDKAVFMLIDQKLKRVSSVPVKRYFEMRSDMLNAIMLLRIGRMNGDAAFLRDMLLTGGHIPHQDWVKAFEKPDMIGKLLSSYGRGVKLAVSAAVQDAGKLPALEKAMDDALLRLFSPYRREALRLEPVVGFILSAEREAAAVRLILAGKLNGFGMDAIRERLRELYGN